MKNTKTLVEMILKGKITNEQIDNIVSNDIVKAETMTAKEKLEMLTFAELARALNSKTRNIVLDCNYPQSRNTVPRLDYFRLVSTDTRNASMIQLYMKSNFTEKKNSDDVYIKFDICTSCAKVNREAFAGKFDELGIVSNGKTSFKKAVPLSDIVALVNDVCAVLASTEKKEEKSKEETSEK